MAGGRADAREWTLRLLLVVISLLIGFILLEVGARLMRGPGRLLHWENRVQQRQEMYNQQVNSRFIRDVHIGVVPRPNYRSADSNNDEQGIRMNRAPGTPVEAETLALPPILAVGDSYTYGDEVSDFETLPAALERQTRRRTVNAGVNGLGLDQVVLRTEQQVRLQRPTAIVLSFIYDDFRRGEFGHLWGAEKPYFTISSDGTELIAHNQTVPLEAGPRGGWSIWQRLLGWSMVLDTIMLRLDRTENWAYGDIRTMPKGEGIRLACLLMHRLRTLSVPTLIVAEYEPSTWTVSQTIVADRRVGMRHTLDCADAAGLASLDTFDVVEKAVQSKGVKGLYINQHLNGFGNALVAEAIATELLRRGILQK